jgi:hypothetical protein
MPREWGRDPFYLYAQRTETKVMATLMRYDQIQYTNPQNTLKSHLAMGYFDLPTLKRLN